VLIPSIDLYDGKAVQWRQGKERVLERDNVFELLEAFSCYGEVAVVDLQAAKGEGDNRALIEEMLRRVPCRVGGGIRDLETARHYIKAGASRIMIGTAMREEWVRELPHEALIFCIDSRGDELLSHGWDQGTGEKTGDLLQDLGSRCSEFLYTQVEKEGMMAGLDRARARAIVAGSPVPVTIAGGITTLDDVRFLQEIGANGQVGMALYTGKIDLADSLIARIDFEKMGGLIPTVVQDAQSGDVLMMAYSNEASLREALSRRRGVYWSRSRGQLWAKGETSGHIQELVAVDLDCDGDSLLFRIRQTGPACHLNRWSCFPRVNRRFSLHTLDATLAERRASMPEGSYSAKLFGSSDLRAEKLREETEELIEAADRAEVRWEAADLLYFTLVEARASGVSLDDIVHELRSRHGHS